MYLSICQNCALIYFPYISDLLFLYYAPLKTFIKFLIYINIFNLIKLILSIIFERYILLAPSDSDPPEKYSDIDHQSITRSRVDRHRDGYRTV